MGRKIRDSEYNALGELRYRIREFLRGSDEAANAAGLEPQQYQMLLAIRGLPNPGETSIRRLSERLLLRHHSAVGLIDRLEDRGYIRRTPSGLDQRQLCVILLPKGQRALERVVRERLHELRESGHALISALASILKQSQGTRASRTLATNPSKKKRRSPESGHPPTRRAKT
ncbi:MAG TPA: MarR family transcriptional regulator [Candidatus Acidoferrum sp.]|nr:MarR family transcriptional regulator [Candidatus Acidoferrum sp.]